MTEPNYWLPSWWNWMQDWSDCAICLEYNHTPCASCELPPGLLGLVCLVGGGTATVAGTMRGNVGIESAQQARAAARVSGPELVNQQLQRQQVDVNIQSVDLEVSRETFDQVKRRKQHGGHR